jgi:CheY-like chemotaxis protein
LTARSVVLVLDTNVDTVEMLRTALDAAGFSVTSAFMDDIARGDTSLDSMLRLTPPSVVLFDVAIPYDRNWALKEKLQEVPELQGVPFVVTTTNVRRLREVVNEASGEPVIEIIGKPYDIEQIVQAVTRAAGSSQ